MSPAVAPMVERPRPFRPPRPRSRIRDLFELAVLAALLVGALALDASTLLVGALLFAVVVPFEKLFPRHRGQPVRRGGLGTDLAYLVLSPLFSVVSVTVAFAVGVISLAWLPGLALRPVVGMLPPEVAPLAGLILFDLATYWIHRWSHEVPFLWRFHAVHHSTDYLDWVSGFRVHPLDGALIAPPFVFLLAAGFSTEVAGSLAILQIVLGIFLHANVRWRLRPLQRLVVTPEFHHWHHADDPRAIHSNYGIFLPLWDQVFGTWFMPRDRRPEHYGIREPFPRGVVAQIRYPLRGLGHPLDHVRHPLRSTRLLIRGIRELGRQIWRSTRRPTHSTVRS